MTPPKPSEPSPPDVPGQNSVTHPMLNMDFESDGFRANDPLPNGIDTLSVTSDYPLWTAITVAGPSGYFVFRRGT